LLKAARSPHVRRINRTSNGSIGLFCFNGFIAMSATSSATPENRILKEKASGHNQQFSPRAILTVLVVVAIGVIAELIEANIQAPTHPTLDPFPQVISFWDARAFLWINNGLANQYLGWVFSILTRLGSTDPILVVSVLLFAVGRKKEGALLFTSVILGSLVTLPLKLAVPRPRPYMTIPATIAYGMELGSSFPSGHSMRAFASACVLSRFWSRFAPAFFVLAVLVAFSRVYLGLHYPSDTLIGASIGLIVGYLSVRFQDKILKLFRLEA